MNSDVMFDEDFSDLIYTYLMAMIKNCIIKLNVDIVDNKPSIKFNLNTFDLTDLVCKQLNLIHETICELPESVQEFYLKTTKSISNKIIKDITSDLSFFYIDYIRDHFDEIIKKNYEVKLDDITQTFSLRYGFDDDLDRKLSIWITDRINNAVKLIKNKK